MINYEAVDLYIYINVLLDRFDVVELTTVYRISRSKRKRNKSIIITNRTKQKTNIYICDNRSRELQCPIDYVII